MRRLSTNEVYRNAWMSVREDDIRFADGSPGIYGVIDKPESVLVVPVDGPDLWLVEQYRYPVQRRAWEFPQGTWSPGRSGSQPDLARSELREETGIQAGRLRSIGYLHGAYAYCSQGFDVFLATDLHFGEPEREISEQDMQHRRFSRAEFEEMLLDGLIVDASTVAAYALLNLHEQRDVAEISRIEITLDT